MGRVEKYALHGMAAAEKVTVLEGFCGTTRPAGVRPNSVEFQESN